MTTGILNKIELTIGLVILAVIVLLVFMASIMRFFGHPLIWSVDFAQLLFIWLCFIGANRALRMKSHLGVDFFIRRFSIRSRFALECAISLVILIFMASLVVKGVELTILNKERLFGDSGIPYALVTIAVPFGCILMSITVVGNIIKALKSRATERELILTKNEVIIEGKQ